MEARSVYEWRGAQVNKRFPFWDNSAPPLIRHQPRGTSTRALVRGKRAPGGDHSSSRALTIDMHWPREVKRTFKAAVGAAGSHDNLYPGAYNQLLHILFPPEGRCVVTPHYQLVADAYGGPDVVLSYEVSWHGDPLLVLQVRPPWHLDSRSKREAADRQLAQRMLDIKGTLNCLLQPRLH